MRRVQLILWIIVAVVAIAAPLYLINRSSIKERSTGIATIGAPFKLMSSKGDAFDSRILDGKPFAVFFGFTHCPDVCPTTTAEMSGMLNELGDAAKDFRVLFITVDPARDTADILKDFLSSFDPRIIGLTGPQDRIAAVVRSYAATAKKVTLENGEYTMDHTASVYLMGRDGKLVSTLDYVEKPDVKLMKLKNLLGE